MATRHRRTAISWRSLAVALTVAAALGSLPACAASSGPPAPLSTDSTGVHTTQQPTPSQDHSSLPPSTSVGAPAPLTAAQLRAHATKAMAALAAARPGVRVSLAATNLATGASYSWGATSGMWTASVYKLLVLETLLMQRQNAGSALSADDVAEATLMIENSNDKAGYAMYLETGGWVGLAEGTRLLGMRHTVPGRNDPTFTTTGARDCLKALRQLVTRGRLDKQSRAFALELMRDVQADQRWGVGVLADPGTTVANKNGWLSVDDTNGPDASDHKLWVVNTLGIVTVHRQRVLMAILSEHNTDRDSGIDLVEALARATLPTLSAPT